MLIKFNLELLGLIFFHFDYALAEEIFLIVLESVAVERGLFSEENGFDGFFIVIN